MSMPELVYRRIHSCSKARENPTRATKAPMPIVIPTSVNSVRSRLRQRFFHANPVNESWEAMRLGSILFWQFSWRGRERKCIEWSRLCLSTDLLYAVTCVRTRASEGCTQVRRRCVVNVTAGRDGQTFTLDRALARCAAKPRPPRSLALRILSCSGPAAEEVSGAGHVLISGRALSNRRRFPCAPCSNRGNRPDDRLAAQKER